MVIITVKGLRKSTYNLSLRFFSTLGLGDKEKDWQIVQPKFDKAFSKDYVYAEPPGSVSEDKLSAKSSDKPKRKRMINELEPEPEPSVPPVESYFTKKELVFIGELREKLALCAKDRAVLEAHIRELAQIVVDGQDETYLRVQLERLEILKESQREISALLLEAEKKLVSTAESERERELNAQLRVIEDNLARKERLMPYSIVTPYSVYQVFSNWHITEGSIDNPHVNTWFKWFKDSFYYDADLEVFSQHSQASLVEDEYGIRDPTSFKEFRYFFFFNFPGLDVLFDLGVGPYFGKWGQWIYRCYVRFWVFSYFSFYGYSHSLKGEDVSLWKDRTWWSFYYKLPFFQRLYRSVFSFYGALLPLFFSLLIMFHIVYPFSILLYSGLNFFVFVRWLSIRLALFYFGWARVNDVDRYAHLPQLRRARVTDYIKLGPSNFSTTNSPTASQPFLWPWEKFDRKMDLPIRERISSYFFSISDAKLYFSLQPLKFYKETDIEESFAPNRPGSYAPMFRFSRFKLQLSSTSGTIFLTRWKRKLFNFINFWSARFNRQFQGLTEKYDWINYASVLLLARPLLGPNIESAIMEYYYTCETDDLEEFLLIQEDGPDTSVEDYDFSENVLSLIDFVVLVFIYQWLLIRFGLFILFGPVLILVRLYERYYSPLQSAVSYLVYSVYWARHIAPMQLYFYWVSKVVLFFRHRVRDPLLRFYNNFLVPAASSSSKFIVWLSAMKNRGVVIFFRRWIFAPLFFPFEYFSRCLIFAFMYLLYAPWFYQFWVGFTSFFFQIATLGKLLWMPRKAELGFAPTFTFDNDAHHGLFHSSPMYWKGHLTSYELVENTFESLFYDEGDTWDEEITGDDYDSDLFLLRSRRPYTFIGSTEYSKNYSISKFSETGYRHYRFQRIFRSQAISYFLAPRRFKPRNFLGSYFISFLLFFGSFAVRLLLFPLCFVCFIFLYYTLIPMLYVYFFNALIDETTLIIFLQDPWIPFYPHRPTGLTINLLCLMFVSFSLQMLFFPFYKSRYHSFNDEEFYLGIFCVWYEATRGLRHEGNMSIYRHYAVEWWGWPFEEIIPTLGGSGFFPGL